MRTSFRLAILAGAALGALAASHAAEALPAGWTCTTAGCGTQTATDGVVTIPTGVSEISWVSTSGGDTGQGLGLGGETTGARLLTNTFSAAAGEQLSFRFNYVTSDGAGFADYAFVQLSDGTNVTTLFTARTTPGGDTVPGFGLPAIDPGVTLTPGATPIIDGAPDWSPLGEGPDTCFAGVGAGCGYTGWIEMDFTIGTAGNYQLIFGVTNWSDDGLQSGLAIAGATIGGDPITPPTGVPTPAALALFGLGVLGLAAARRRRA